MYEQCDYYGTSHLASTCATFACGLSERGVEMVGALPTGLPPVSAPSLSPLLSGQLWASAALLALVGMTETSSISPLRRPPDRAAIRSWPRGRGPGAGKRSGGVPWEFCPSLRDPFPARASTSQEARVARVRFSTSSLPWCAAGGVVPGAAVRLPAALRALAAVVIMAVAGLLDLRRLLALCRADRLDALVALTTFAVTLLVGPGRGILADRHGVAVLPVEDAARAGPRAPLAAGGRVRA